MNQEHAELYTTGNYIGKLHQTLKLPICPKCNNTKGVQELYSYDAMYSMYPWFGCESCGIKWNAGQGIKENR